MKNIKPTATGEHQEVKIKVRINVNGVIQLTSANIVDKKPKEETQCDNGNNENMEVTQEVCVYSQNRTIFLLFAFSYWLTVFIIVFFINICCLTPSAPNSMKKINFQ